MGVLTFFERELQQRGLAFSLDADSGRYKVEAHGAQLLVNLENLKRDFASDGDVGRISRFVDTMLQAGSKLDSALSIKGLYWTLEPNDYEEPAEFRASVSDLVDRVLVHLSDDASSVTWVTPDILDKLGLTESEASAAAFSNLDRALYEAAIEFNEIDGVRLGFLATHLPFKASLLLAPSLREVVAPVLGWPLLAVAPDRDFLYLWAAEHTDFVQRVGGVVVREYSTAAYPISTEVYECADEGLLAIGAFPCPEEGTQ